MASAASCLLSGEYRTAGKVAVARFRPAVAQFLRGRHFVHYLFAGCAVVASPNTVGTGIASVSYATSTSGRFRPQQPAAVRHDVGFIATSQEMNGSRGSVRHHGWRWSRRPTLVGQALSTCCLADRHRLVPAVDMVPALCSHHMLAIPERGPRVQRSNSGRHTVFIAAPLDASHESGRQLRLDFCRNESS